MSRGGSLRIALLTYRGNPHSGGQGVYVRYLSKGLRELGHHVTVFSGPPYPEVGNEVTLQRVPSLDLYRPEDPFRVPARSEFRDGIDILEYALMCTAAFPEPLTFTLRAARILRGHRADFDVVHDNQSLGYGLLNLKRAGFPVVATVHHPCSIDRRLDMAHAQELKRRFVLSRWYSFTRMQARVARRLDRIVCVSESARADVSRDFRVPPNRTGVVHNGVDAELFRPLPEIERIEGLIITTASADVPLKGLLHLVEALAKLRTERDAHLVVVGNARPKGHVATAIERYGLEGAVRFEQNVDWLRLVELYAHAQVAVVPSLYEGFSLPAVEAMSCAVPLVATTGGALPEVVGPDAGAGLLVAPGDAGALAGAIGRLLDDAALRGRIGAAGRRRALERFTWRATAEAVVENYREAIASC
jgi:glycosyltransferase involved in cell wall biosynthesis